MTEVYVLTWEYRDGSGNGIARVYFDQARAFEDFDLLQDADSIRCWFVVTVPVYGPGATKEPADAPHN